MEVKGEGRGVCEGGVDESFNLKREEVRVKEIILIKCILFDRSENLPGLGSKDKPTEQRNKGYTDVWTVEQELEKN